MKVIMNCSEEQYNRDLKKDLASLDFIEKDMCMAAGKYSDLVAGYKGCKNELVRINREVFLDEYKDAYFIDHYNPQLYLALAAMTEGDVPIVGEYLIALRAGGWSYSHDNNGCLIKVKSLGSRELDTKEVIAIDGKIVNPNVDSYVDFRKIPVENREGQRVFRKATKKELINHFKEDVSSQKQETMKTFKVTRQNLKNIYDVACQDWKIKIDRLTTEYLGTFKESGELPESLVREMFGAANDSQKKTLKHVFPEFETEFVASDLKVGEMMLVEGKQINQEFNGETLLRTFEGIVSLSDPRKTWTSNCPLKGRKLKSGESFTIKQP